MYMSNIIWKKKADKYKIKYLALKKQFGGFVPEPEFMTSRIDPKSDYYLSQNLFSYWISSSHNTYLPHDQNTDPVNICYYNLQSMVYAGGCVEIDTNGIKDNDVIITHSSDFIQGSIKLGDILDVIMDALNYKIKNKIISGPFILTFDNKCLNKKSQQNIFWETIDNKLLSGDKVEKYDELMKDKYESKESFIPVQKIDDKFDLLDISIKNMSDKILLRWGLNKINKCETEKVGHELCPPDNKQIIEKFSSNINKWIHLEKSKMEIMENLIDCKDLPEGEYCTNMSKSSSSPSTSKLTPINLFSIVNTQRFLSRIFPSPLNIFSGNYENMKYFRDGVQITAINLQRIGNERLLNDAVFIPPTSKFCSPQLIIKGCENINDFQSYRLKPLWLLGLVPYPQLYDLKITVPNSEFTITYGLNSIEYKSFKETNQQTKIDEYIIKIPNIDVTVPFFIVEHSGFKNGIEIVWNQQNLNLTENLSFSVNKFNEIITGKFDKTKYNKVNTTDNCQNDRLLNYLETREYTLKYTWTTSNSNENDNHMKLVEPYNKSIILSRTAFKKPTSELLTDLNKLKEYQTSELLTDLNKLKEYQRILFDEIKKKNLLVQQKQTKEDVVNN